MAVIVGAAVFVPGVVPVHMLGLSVIVAASAAMFPHVFASALMAASAALLAMVKPAIFPPTVPALSGPFPTIERHRAIPAIFARIPPLAIPPSPPAIIPQRATPPRLQTLNFRSTNITHSGFLLRFVV